MKTHHLQIRLIAKCCLFILGVVITPIAQAWGSHGHRVIALIAERHLTPEASVAIAKLSNDSSLFDMSTWADEMRSTGEAEPFWGYDYSANWHFINIAKGQSYAQSKKAPQGDAYSALLAFSAILTNKTPKAGPVKEALELYLASNLKTAESKNLALKFLIHVIADLHQPLHVGYPEDRGGNNIDVYWNNRKINLHTLWDSRLFQEQSINQHMRVLLTKMESRSDTKQVASATPEDWLHEALLLRDRVYSQTTMRPNEQEYLDTFAPIADELLIKAGLRTAYLLNSLLK